MQCALHEHGGDAHGESGWPRQIYHRYFVGAGLGQVGLEFKSIRGRRGLTTEGQGPGKVVQSRFMANTQESQTKMDHMELQNVDSQVRFQCAAEHATGLLVDACNVEVAKKARYTLAAVQLASAQMAWPMHPTMAVTPRPTMAVTPAPGD